MSDTLYISLDSLRGSIVQLDAHVSQFQGLCALLVGLICSAITVSTVNNMRKP